MPELFEESHVLKSYLQTRGIPESTFISELKDGDIAATIIFAASRLAVAIGDAQQEIVAHCSRD